MAGVDWDGVNLPSRSLSMCHTSSGTNRMDDERHLLSRAGVVGRGSLGKGWKRDPPIFKFQTRLLRAWEEASLCRTVHTCTRNSVVLHFVLGRRYGIRRQIVRALH